MNQNKMFLMASLGLTMGALSAQAQSAAAAPAVTLAVAAPIVGGAISVPDTIGCPWAPLYTPSSTNLKVTINDHPFLGYNHDGKAFGQ